MQIGQHINLRNNIQDRMTIKKWIERDEARVCGETEEEGDNPDPSIE